MEENRIKGELNWIILALGLFFLHFVMFNLIIAQMVVIVKRIEKGKEKAFLKEIATRIRDNYQTSLRGIKVVSEMS